MNFLADGGGFGMSVLFCLALMGFAAKKIFRAANDNPDRAKRVAGFFLEQLHKRK
jgi:hypothetical protein